MSEAIHPERLRPHSELFRTEKGALVEVEGLIVTTEMWNADPYCEDQRWRVRPLPGDRVLALRTNI
jgi:hypothetical protein